MSEKKQKVLIIGDYFTPHWTGIAVATHAISKALTRDYDVSVLTVRYKKSLPKNERIGKINVIRSDYIFTLSRAVYSWRMIFDFLRVARDFQIIFINSPFTNILPIVIIAKFMRKKVLLFHHGDLILPSGFINFIIEKIFDITTIFSLYFVDKVSTHSKDYALNSRILSGFMMKFTPLILPVNRPKFIKKRKLNIKSINIGFAGRFTEEKGFDILLLAIPYILKKFPDAKFYYAGQSKLPYENFFAKHAHLQKTYKKNLIFLGLLKDRNLESFYSSLDLLVAPSRSDCFNLVQAEAALRGVPVIVTDIPGLRFLVDTTSFGYKAIPGNLESLVEKIELGIRNRQILKQNYNKVASLLDNKINVEKIIQFISS